MATPVTLKTIAALPRSLGVSSRATTSVDASVSPRSHAVRTASAKADVRTRRVRLIDEVMAGLLGHLACRSRDQATGQLLADRAVDVDGHVQTVRQCARPGR